MKNSIFWLIKTPILLACCMYLCVPILSAQKAKNTKAADKNLETIYLENPSFEDFPRAGQSPAGWADCGSPVETPPDVQPFGGFRVTKAAQHGSTYLGLVTRDNNTWESVSQPLSKAIKKGICYNFSIFAARSEIYESATKKNPLSPTNFDKSVTVRVWAGNSTCERKEMLAQSEVVGGLEWKQINLKFTPKNGDYQYITIEAYYKTPTLVPYNGNILLDNASPIVACDAPETPDNVLANNDNPNKNPDKNPNKTDVKTDPKTVTSPSVKVDTAKKDPVNVVVKEENKGDFKEDLQAKDLKIGHTFRLQNLYFKADSINFTSQSERTVTELFNFLKKNANVVVEIGGHTNGLPDHDYCDKLSNSRAQKVTDFLLKKGISPNQIKYKGYGKRKPLESNDTEVGRQRNQRVEVKILEIK